MLFQRVDRSEWDRVYGQAQERLGRIDSGLAAVKQAVAKTRSAGIAPTEALPVLPVEAIADTGAEGNGAALATSLLRGLENVEALRAEAAELGKEIHTRELDIAAAQKAEGELLKKRVRNAFKFAGAVVIYLLFRACLAAMSHAGG